MANKSSMRKVITLKWHANLETGPNQNLEKAESSFNFPEKFGII